MGGLSNKWKKREWYLDKHPDFTLSGIKLYSAKLKPGIPPHNQSNMLVLRPAKKS